ncbi:hypothetical protein ElyMa_001053300 [Elysia marginata]|uniref:Uncharacterized protein n=1 Tax=Elysia marginata TaxID=1093978 RepID=A0AAV4HP97_9GAST|nr:hypothetical protein ElyMa_001053300 [Elysia marginata]
MLSTSGLGMEGWHRKLNNSQLTNLALNLRLPKNWFKNFIFRCEGFNSLRCSICLLDDSAANYATSWRISEPRLSYPGAVSSQHHIVQARAAGQTVRTRGSWCPGDGTLIKQ